MGTFLTRPEIAAHQLRALRALISAVGDQNSFYKTRITGFPAEFDSFDAYRANVPFTTKPEIARDQLENPPYGTNHTHELSAYTRLHQTSGTSGKPIRWLDTPESWSNLVDNWLEVFKAAGATSADRVYFAFSFGPFIGFWLAFEAGQRLGALCIPGGGLGSAARLRSIIENGATILCCTPTYALRLGEVAIEEKIDLTSSRVRLIIVAGEPGGSIPSVRSRIESTWRGARVFDHHGMTEVGPVTYECPLHPGVLHVNETAYFPEVIDPATDEPVEGGGVGELILTTLNRTASPLLRYRTGDFVRIPAGWRQFSDAPAEPCACGRYHLPLEGGILGRVDDMVVVRGVNVYPTAVDDLVRQIPEIIEYQAKVQTIGSLSELSIAIETAGSGERAASRLQSLFEQNLSLRVPVKAMPVGALPRFEMKARRWLRE